MFLGGGGLYILKIIGMIELGPTFRIFSTNLENATRIKIQFGKGWRNQALYGNKAELGIYNVDDNTSKEHSNLIQPQKGFCLEAELRISIREKKTMVSSQKEILFNQIKVHRNLRVPEFSWVETRSSYKTPPPFGNILWDDLWWLFSFADFPLLVLVSWCLLVTHC